MGQTATQSFAHGPYVHICWSRKDVRRPMEAVSFVVRESFHREWQRKATTLDWLLGKLATSARREVRQLRCFRPACFIEQTKLGSVRIGFSS